MPTQTPKAGSNTVTAKDGTPLNPMAVNLAKAIRQQESGGDYNAVGDLNKGVSHGAYQFNKDNFKTWASEEGLDPNDFSPTNQDKVAYARINKDLQSGLAPSEVVAKWNGAKIVNGKYEAINPQYVEDVKQHYATIVGGQQQSASVAQAVPQQNNPLNPPPPALDTGIPSAMASTGDTPPDESVGQKALGIAGKVGNFLLPAVGDAYNALQGKGLNGKTWGQVAGDIGMTALTVVPGLGEVGLLGRGLEAAGLAARGIEAADVASNAAKAAKVGGEISQGVKSVTAAADVAKTGSKIPGILKGPISKGLALGYGSDVSSNLQKGETDPTKILTPGLGTVTGGAFGVGEKALASGGAGVAGRLVNSLIKPLKKNFAYGKNPGLAVAEEGIVGNNLDDLARNIGARRQEIGNQIGQIGASVPDLRINLTRTLAPIDEGMEQAAKSNNPAMFSRLQQTRRALTENLGVGMDESGAPAIISKGARNLADSSYQDAQALKQHIGDMTQWTGNLSDDKAVNAALQGVWRNISNTQKGGLNSVDPALRQRLEHLNDRYGNLTEAEIATKYREAIHGRQNMISLGDKLGGVGGLMTGILTGGGTLGAGMGALAGTATSHALGSTAVKTRAAAALAKIAGKGSVSGARTYLGIPGLIGSLGKTAAIRKASGQ